MRDFNVLLTCSGMYAKNYADLLQNNEDGVKVHVYSCNMDETKLPPKGCTDGDFVVPPINDTRYRECLDDICFRHHVNIIIPTVTAELEYMADAASDFERYGIKVSISPSETIKVANDKIALQQRYKNLMPLQSIPKDFSEALSFSKWLPKGSKMCCKLSNHAGGNGFAIIDDSKAVDPSYFNRYATDRYISMRDLQQILENRHEVLLQEYVEGYDYSVCVLANYGIVSHIVGIAGKVMSYGAIMNGEIEYNADAYKIAEDITRELEIDGNACFDFRIDKNGKPMLLEINPRVSASLPFVRAAGINMLYLRCKNLLGDFSDLGKAYPIKYGLKMRKYYETVYYE